MNDRPATLVWFRSDLRLHDNPALAAAAAVGGRVEALFVACPEQWRRKHDWGDPKEDFVARSVAALRNDLAALGIPLRVRRSPWFEDVPSLVVEEARRLGCGAIACNREWEVNEEARDRAVGEAVRSAGLDFDMHDDQAVVPVGALETGAGAPYSVFTPFWRSWLRHVKERGVAERGSPDAVGPPIDPASLDDDWSPGEASFRSDLWPAGEGEALERLRRFLNGAGERYDRQRDTPAVAGTSGLSPYLAAGALSPRRALVAAVEANGGELEGGRPGPAAWIRQLAWRDFYRSVLAGFPRVSRRRAFREDYEALEWRRAPEDLAAWEEGRTGVPIVDAGMRQLRQTGWMHNRLRMVTAMFLTKHLLLDWRLGEAFFMRRLVDADLANNNGGWQWSASVGTDAAPYFRIFNPWTQGRRFDADGTYIRRFVPELGPVANAALHKEKGPALEERRAAGYPPPIVDHRAARERALALFRDLG